jgi:hypothetical protein
MASDSLPDCSYDVGPNHARGDKALAWAWRCGENRFVRIELHDKDRKRQFAIDVDEQKPASVVRAPDGTGTEFYLDWEQAKDDQGFLRHCPACSCRELFVRKDFPQVTGFLIVVFAAIGASILFGYGMLYEMWIVLGVLAIIDGVIYLFSGRCLVCYRCRSEFRKLPISPKQPGWELAIGEKYRPIHQAMAGADLADSESDTSANDPATPEQGTAEAGAEGAAAAEPTGPESEAAGNSIESSGESSSDDDEQVNSQ